jgi:hypothetical protein
MPSNRTLWPPKFPSGFEKSRRLAAFRSPKCSRALERGLEDLWGDLVLAQSLDGELDREEAIERVGRTKVERAERAREVVEEDVDWGLNA